MNILRINGATRTLGEQQGFIPLPVYDHFVMTDPANGLVTHYMVTAWEPMPDELEQIKAGAPILLSIMGATGPGDLSVDSFIAKSRHPPVMITVGDEPSDG